MSTKERHPRKTGFYWVKLGITISDGWEVAHWSQVMRTWQIHGRDKDYEEDMIDEVDETPLTHAGYDES